MKALFRIVLLLLTLSPGIVMAQVLEPGNSSALSGVPQALGKKVLDECLKDQDGCTELPADVLVTAVSTPIPSSTCAQASPTPTPKDGNEEQTTVLLVSELHSARGWSGVTQSDIFLRWPQYETLSDLPPINASWNSQSLIDGINHHYPFSSSGTISQAEKQELERNRQSLLIQGLGLLATKGPKMSDEEFVQKMTDTINLYSSDRETKLQILTRLSDYLYYAYNDKRNPLQNTHHDPIPTGNISLQQMMVASQTDNSDMGGVCNDITQGLAVVAQKLFPKDDALVINSGSHYALMVSDQDKVHTVITWSDRTESKGQVILDKDLPVTNTRISKVIDGKLREIAIADTELGQVFKMVSGKGTKVIQTGYTPSIVKAEFERGRNSYIAATAQTSTGQVLVLVAQHRGKFLGMESFTQAGLGAQKVTGEKYPWNAVVSFQEVLSKRVFHYVGPGVKISGTAGTQLDLSYGHGLNMSSLSSFIPSFSGNIQTFQKVDFSTTPKNPKSPIFSGTVEADQFVGFRDIGKHGGAISAPGWDGVSKMLSTSGLMLSQVNVTGGMTVPINSKISSRTQVGYQGTNIGQVAEITTGMNIQAASGVKVFAFVGYKNADLPGYMTQSSLIQQATGFESGARVVTPGGMNLSGKVEGLGGPSGPQADLTLGIPIQGKKKKKPPTTVVAP